MLNAWRTWRTAPEGPAGVLHSVYRGDAWCEGITRAMCDRCQRPATAECIDRHGAGIYACMDADHVHAYTRLVCQGQAPSRVHAGEVMLWGHVRTDGVHVWAEYAIPLKVGSGLARQAHAAHARMLDA